MIIKLNIKYNLDRSSANFDWLRCINPIDNIILIELYYDCIYYNINIPNYYYKYINRKKIYYICG